MSNIELFELWESTENEQLTVELEGVVVAKKDFNQPKHEDIDTKNLYVIKALQSLNSKGFVKTQFSWQYYYYTLTEAGVDYLREWLHLPQEIVPDTYKKQSRPAASGMRPVREDRRPQNSGEGYRRRDNAKEVAGGQAPQFN